MPLFQRRRFVWNEPWFFQQRIRTRKAWVLFALLLIALPVAVCGAIYFGAPPGRQFNLLQLAGLGVGLAAMLWWVLDGTNSRRQAVLFEDSIVVGGDMGKYSTPTTYKLSEIRAVAIVMPEESKWPERALFFHYDGEEQAIGIDQKLSLPRLAQALHDAGLFVRLDGWQPDQESEFQKAFFWETDRTNVVERARMETLPPGTPSLMTVGGILLAIVRQCWAIALWLLVTAAAIWYGWRNWNDLGLVQMVLLIGIPIGVLYVAGTFTDRFACASTSFGLRRMALGQIRKRAGVEIDPEADDLLPVEILAPEQFAKSIQKIRELGYLQADPINGRILFEGKKERWCVPARSIQSVAIEEVQTGTPGQSAVGALNYYVVVKFAADGEQEVGFRDSHRDYGEMNDVKRAAGAIRVFEAIESVLPRKESGPSFAQAELSRTSESRSQLDHAS
jgi:hypothetical protein